MRHCAHAERSLEKRRTITGKDHHVRKTFFIALAVVAALALRPAESRADFSSITFTGNVADNTGTGFGAIDNVLSLQPMGSATTESGGINGAGTLSGDAKNTSQALTVDQLTSPVGMGAAKDNAGITYTPGSAVDFVVIFQVNQKQSMGSATVDLSTFQLDFYDKNGNQLSAPLSLVFNDTTGPSTEALPGTGVGTSGWIFDVHLDATDADAFFGTKTNVLGMSVPSSDPIDNANDGPENFYIAASQSVVTVPVPSSALLLGTGVLGLAGFVGLRRRLKATAAA
jgi:hypothetical protein